jgi:6-phosphogluconate dehydrogenase (decarboxylating)
MSETLTEKAFTELLQQKFEVQAAGVGQVDVELVEVKPIRTGQTEGFSLMFRGPKDRVFRHDTHMFKHAGLGEFSLFVGPVMSGKTDGVYYQAVFNRIKSA